MSRLLEGGTKVLSGPYGSVLRSREKELGVLDLHDSTRIVEGGHYRTQTLAVARAYVEAGAGVIATNTFGARRLLREDNPGLYREVVEAQIAVVREALSGHTAKNLVAAFGPYGDCYDPSAAPNDSYDARDFHLEQLGVVRDLWKEVGLDAVVFETICTGREALGIVLAAKKLGLPVIPSFVIDKDAKLFGGEPLVDVLRQIDAATNNYALGYSVNCCPVKGAEAAIGTANGKRDRLLMVYPNASDGDPRSLEEVEGAVTVPDHHTRPAQLVSMAIRNSSIKVIGGCCGFDPHDIENIVNSVEISRDARGAQIALG